MQRSASFDFDKLVQCYVSDFFNFVSKTTKRITMPRLTFNSCCGCIDLRTGCFIIAYFLLVADIVLCTMLGFATKGFVETVLQFEDREAEKEAVVLLLVSSVMLVLALLMLAFVTTLLVGLHKHKRAAVKTFLVGCAIYIVLDTIMFIVNVTFDPSALTIVTQLVEFALDIFVFLVIRSYFFKMDHNKGAIINTA